MTATNVFKFRWFQVESSPPLMEVFLLAQIVKEPSRACAQQQDIKPDLSLSLCSSLLLTLSLFLSLFSLSTLETCNIHVQQEGHRTRHCIYMLGYSMVRYTCTTRGPQRLDTASTCWATAWYNIHVQQEGHRDQTLHPHVGLQHGTIYMYNKRATETRHCNHMLGYSMVQYTCTTRGPQRLDTASTCWLQHGTIYMYNKGPQRLDTASTCWATALYNIHVQQAGHRDQTLHPHVGLQHGIIYMHNKSATETRHCIHMLGYSMVQYTCTTRGPQRLDTASTCWATAWYNIHAQQECHRDQTLHPHVGLQHGTIYMYNKRATETRHCIHMLGYNMVQYTCTTRVPQRLDTASTCWLQHGTIYMYNKSATETRHCIHMLATAWYNIHVQQECHRDQTLHPHVGLQHGTIYMYNKRATETRHCIHMLGSNMEQFWVSSCD